MEPVPDPLLLRKSGSAGNRTRDLWICSQKLRPLDHRGGPVSYTTISFIHYLRNKRTRYVKTMSFPSVRPWHSISDETLCHSIMKLLLLLLVIRYNPFKVLACSTTLFHLSHFCVTFFQLHTFMLFISSKTSSSQRNLGLPVCLLDMGFHLLIFFTLLSSSRISLQRVV